ncbi:12342_t:CDS:2 [Entrophospora sp. SA101]|nr:12342_t:CDS:2 [Entrophospora sp. SA101]CAJ0906847.1 14236_t:CDS:2 [Entrophospora sp. SA101]
MNFYRGAVKRYPYPKQVWSPAGGWWTRPSNWKSNTAICAAGIIVMTGVIWKISSDHEWSKQFKDGEYNNLKFEPSKPEEKE